MSSAASNIRSTGAHVLVVFPLQAKTAIAPLDRVKILFQTSNADFKKFAGELPFFHCFGVTCG